MSSLPPRWALGAQAIHASGEPHIRKGVHLRITPSPLIGLPIRPFVLYRLDLGREASQLFRSDVTWVDSEGRVLTTPFTVTKDNPVTGLVPVFGSQRCIAIGVSTGQKPPKKTVELTHRSIEIERAALAHSSSLRVAAFRNSPQGRVEIGVRTETPHFLSASEIHGVTVSGSGTILGAVWVEASGLKPSRLKAFRLLAFPRESASRYQGIGDAADVAMKRVLLGAPLRFGMHDEPSAADPPSCSPATEEDERKRIEALIADLKPSLDRLLDDMSAVPFALRTPITIDQGQGNASVATASLQCLGAVLGGSLDPGIGRWLGFMDIDEDPGVTSGAVLYGPAVSSRSILRVSTCSSAGSCTSRGRPSPPIDPPTARFPSRSRPSAPMDSRSMIS